ncbi:MAG: hypothetical protein ACK5EP_00410 [Bacteroidota bacterium]|jgi:hypothetical protein
MGSRFAGSITMYQNPASTIASKDTIDFSIASLQVNNYTNFIQFGYAPLLRKNPITSFDFTEGDYERDLITSLNLSLLSAKYKLNPKTAVGFGINFRSMINVHTSHYNLTDSSTDIIAFLEQNTGSLPFKGNAATSNWMEYVGNFSHNLVDNRKMILNAGVNLRLNRGLLGLIGSIDSLEFQKANLFGNDFYTIKNADFLYGYSTTATAWDNTQRFRENWRNVMRETKWGASIDMGAEWLIKSNKESDWFYEGLDYNYKWKIGLSLLDLGYANYQYYPESVKTNGIKEDMTPEILLDKFIGVIDNIASFNDTVSTVVQSFTKLNGNFKIFHPARWLLNIDRRITGNFFMNVAANIPISFVNRNANYVLNDAGIFSFTSRYEGERVGLYLPVMYNTKTKLNIGAAVRMGPVIVGLNNLNVFNNKVSLQNSSGYMSLLIRVKPKVKKPNFDFIKSPQRVS